METLELGPTPPAESCQQIGTDTYDPQAARAECQRYIRALEHHLGAPPQGARWTITRNAHDFGTYYEVALRFDDNNEELAEAAWNYHARAENAPDTWAALESGMPVRTLADVG